MYKSSHTQGTLEAALHTGPDPSNSNTVRGAAWRGHGVWPVPSSSFFLLDSGARSYRLFLSFPLLFSVILLIGQCTDIACSIRFLPLSPVLLASISTSARLDIDIYRRMPPVEYLLAAKENLLVAPDDTPPADTHPLPRESSLSLIYVTIFERLLGGFRLSIPIYRVDVAVVVLSIL